MHARYNSSSPPKLSTSRRIQSVVQQSEPPLSILLSGRLAENYFTRAQSFVLLNKLLSWSKTQILVLLLLYIFYINGSNSCSCALNYLFHVPAEFRTHFYKTPSHSQQTTRRRKRRKTQAKSRWSRRINQPLMPTNNMTPSSSNSIYYSSGNSSINSNNHSIQL
jgi:hypothetical protein